MAFPTYENIDGVYKAVSRANVRVLNAAGDVASTTLASKQALDTLTYVNSKVNEQKFYEIPIADYVPLDVGNGAWMDTIRANFSYNGAGSFSSGIVNTGGSNSRLASVTAGLGYKDFQTRSWAVETNYSFIDQQKALAANNWDFAIAQQKAAKKFWDLGVQDTAMLGLTGDSSIEGLLNNSAWNVNVALITKAISSMTASEFMTVIQQLAALYEANASYIFKPNRFVIPRADYLGLTTAVSPTYPNKTMLEHLTMALDTMYPGIKIIGEAYCNAAVNNAKVGLNKNVYLLYRHDSDCLKMDIPVDYSTLVQSTPNGFHINSVSYGQFSGVQVIRPLSGLIFQY